MPVFRFQGADGGVQISDFRFQTSDGRVQMAVVRFQTSDVSIQMVELGAAVQALFRTFHYSTNIRHCCMVGRNFNLGEGKADWFYMVMGDYRVFQGKFGWGILGKRRG